VDGKHLKNGAFKNDDCTVTCGFLQTEIQNDDIPELAEEVRRRRI